MLSAFLQALAIKLAEEIAKRVLGPIVPRALRSVPAAASPNCPRCGGYGVARWAPAGAGIVLVGSLLAFALGFTFLVLGLPAVVLTVAAAIIRDGVAGLPRGLLGVLGLLVPATVAVSGAFGLAWYHSHPPRWCARCQARWPRQDRAAYLRAARLFRCVCGQRLRALERAGRSRLRCPRCGTEQVPPTGARR